ncbi:MAG: hypothetical protein O7G32_07510 [SAR324 cluster bacterium]|nr:hypothetical protein [SAR324 cluster bacterium]
MRSAISIHLRVICAVAIFVLLAAACTPRNAIVSPERTPLFGEVVDSIVVEPITETPDLATGLNADDIKLFQQELSSQFARRPSLRVFAEPPSALENTLIITGQLIEFEVQDLPGEDFFLRAIHMGIQLSLRTANQEQASRTLRRRMSYQKIYLPGEGVPVVNFDLKKAAEEIAELLSEVMFPTELEGALPLADGRDPDTGKDMAHPLLLKGIEHALDDEFVRAAESWRLVLFDPTQKPFRRIKIELWAEKPFRLSRRSFGLLRKQGVEEETLNLLEPLKTKSPMTLVDFREELRELLGGISKIESTIMTAANHEEDRIRLNLAAAHRNLAALYWLESRYDLAVYHLARAWANYPRQEYVAKWNKIQQARGILTEDLPPEEGIALYLRIPPPRTVRLRPGIAENSLFVPAVFEQERSQAVPSSESAAPPSRPEQSGVLRPVVLPPPPGSPRGSESSPLTPEAPERADAGRGGAS